MRQPVSWFAPVTATGVPVICKAEYLPTAKFSLVTVDVQTASERLFLSVSLIEEYLLVQICQQ